MSVPETNSATFQASSNPTPVVSDNVSLSSMHDKDDGVEHAPVRIEGEEKATTTDSGFPGLQRTPTKTNPPMSLIREIMFCFVTCGCQFFTQATLSQALSPLLIIGASFGNPDPSQLSWMIASFSLTVGTFILPAGRLGDMFGHKTMMIAGYVWLSLWSLVAGCSVYTQNQIFFDFCRAMQGIGCSALLPNGLALLGTTYPPGPRKAIVFSLFGAMAPTGSVFGALFGALMAQLAWWPWAFWLLCIVAGLLAIMSALVVPNRSDLDDTSSLHASQKFDYWGTLLGVAGLILFNVAWNQAPSVGWDSAYVLVFLIVGILLFIAFVYVEHKVDQPLVPMESIKGKSGLVLACVLLGWSSFGIWVYYFYQFCLVLQENTPLNLAAQLVPTIPAGCSAAAVVAVLIARVKASWLMVAAMCAFMAGNILFVTNEPGRLYWYEVFWSMVVTPFGMDISFPASTLILSNLAHKKHQGKAASLVTTVVNYAIALGLGIAGTVEVHVNNGGQNKADLLKGYRGAWYAAIGLAGLGILCGIYFVISDYVGEGRDKKRDAEKAEIESDT